MEVIDLNGNTYPLLPDVVFSLFSKQALFHSHSVSAMDGLLKSICLAIPQEVSFTKTNGGYFRDRYRSAASRTDSCSSRNFEATVH